MAKRAVPLFPTLLFLFTVIPLVELFILLQMGKVLGPMMTIFLVLGTGILGASMVKKQGMLAWRRAQGELAQGRFPGDALADALLLLIGGALLITPGILTDLAGFSTLMPGIRAAYKDALKRSFTGRGVHIRGGGFQRPTPPPPRQDGPRETVETSHNTEKQNTRSPFDERSPFDHFDKKP